MKLDQVQVCIMELVTQEPGKQKEHSKIYKIPDTTIQKLENLLRNVWMAVSCPISTR